MRQHHNIFTARITENGGPGDDELTGGPGDDDLRGYGGSDVISGGGGDDRLAGMDGVDDLYGGPGDDTGYGGPGDDYLTAGEGNDRFYGGPGDDLIYGGPGIDRLAGGPGIDQLYGGAGADEGYGGPGDDYILGEAGNDRLYGGAGLDLLNGGDGADLISGGPGLDLLSGGAGADAFRFAPGHSLDGDVITDFDYAAGDRIVLTGFSSGATLTPAYDADGDFRSDDRQIILPDGGRVTLRDVGDAELSIEGVITETRPGGETETETAPAPDPDPDPAPDILADGETYFVDHWISRWSLRIDEAPAIGTAYQISTSDDPNQSFQLSLNGNLTGTIWPVVTETWYLESFLEAAAGLSGVYAPIIEGLKINVEGEGRLSAAEAWLIEFNKDITLELRNAKHAWGPPYSPDVDLVEVAATYPAAFTLTFDEREVELPSDVGKAGLDGLAEHVFIDLGLTRITATEVDEGAWELELETTAPIDALDFTAEGAVLELLA